MMNDWYKKGLVQQDFYAHGNFFTARDDMAKGEVGSAECTYDLTTYTNVFTDPTWTVVAAPYPVKNRGDIPHVRQNQDIMRMNFCEAITTAVSEEDLAIILRYYDYMFTDEGSLLANWGIEGVTFEYDENGNPQYTDLIRNNPEGLTFLGANAAYLGSRNEAGIYEWTRELDETTLECMEAWNIADNDWMFPDAATMTQEENTTFASIMSDIDTLLSENCIAFIIGSRPLSELDGFLNQIKGMGLDQATAIKQASLDRYFARLG